MSDKKLITLLLDRNAALEEEVKALRAELAFYKSGRNSKNSHLLPG